jgi:DNA-binding response OmpR family regulator
VETERRRLLVVDDDEQLRELLTIVLQREGFSVTATGDAAGALDCVRRSQADLVVLDVALGDGDGRVVLSEIRRLGNVPVILISAYGESADRVLGLRLGADDYLTKPFAPVELVARVETVLRRSSPGGAPEPADGLRVDDRTREAFIDGRPVPLTAKEFDLLAFLARSPRQVFSRGQLLQQVWSSSSDWQDEATVTEHVRRVRRKIEADPDHPRWITTVRGVGYRFEP